MWLFLGVGLFLDPLHDFKGQKHSLFLYFLIPAMLMNNREIPACVCYFQNGIIWDPDAVLLHNHSPFSFPSHAVVPQKKGF